MTDGQGGQRQRILRVRETQKRIALGRLAEAARSVGAIDRRCALLDRLIDDTVPRVQSCRGVVLIGQMRFAARLQSAQTSLACARDDAATAHAERSTELREADSRVEIAARMVEAEAVRRVAYAQRRLIEGLCPKAKHSPEGRI